MFYEYENEKENYYCTFEYKPLDFPLHIHQVIELVHVIQGEIVMQIGPKTYTLKPGQLALAFQMSSTTIIRCPNTEKLFFIF